MSVDEKRAILASWASDAHAVPHVPALRQLPDGSIVKLDDILQALRNLDELSDMPQPDRQRVVCGGAPKRRSLPLRLWPRYSPWRRGSDDPPPEPARRRAANRRPITDDAPATLSKPDA
jgi:hypothetical protein